MQLKYLKIYKVIGNAIYYIRTLLVMSHISLDLFNIGCLLNYICNVSLSLAFVASFPPSSPARFISVQYTLERLFLCFHCEKLWMVPTESPPFSPHPSIGVPSTLTQFKKEELETLQSHDWSIQNCHSCSEVGCGWF